MDYGFLCSGDELARSGHAYGRADRSESKAELDRFCEAMIAIHGELCAIESAALDRADNPLKKFPHTAAVVMMTPGRMLIRANKRPYPSIG